MGWPTAPAWLAATSCSTPRIFCWSNRSGTLAASKPVMNHGLSLNDFYSHHGTKLGNIHVHPVPVTRDMTLAFMRMHMKRLNRLPLPVLSAAASVGAMVHRSSMVFSTVLEDLPYLCNRVDREERRRRRRLLRLSASARTPRAELEAVPGVQDGNREAVHGAATPAGRNAQRVARLRNLSVWRQF